MSAVVEYMDDSKVHMYFEQPVVVKKHEDPPHWDITVGGFSWTRQAHGKAAPAGKTFNDIFKLMESLMATRKYSALDHNCHWAQEATRRAVGSF